MTGTTDGHRGGETYQHARDYIRLNEQARRVYDLMKDGQWRTLAQIAKETGDPEASISARLRDFRKERFGNMTLNREYVCGGLHRYQLIAKSIIGHNAGPPLVELEF